MHPPRVVSRNGDSGGLRFERLLIVRQAGADWSASNRPPSSDDLTGDHPSWRLGIASAALSRSSATEDDMANAIELAFVIAGLFALMWAIMSPNAGMGRRAAAGGFGLLALLIAVLLHGEDAERRTGREQVWRFLLSVGGLILAVAIVIWAAKERDWLPFALSVVGALALAVVVLAKLITSW